MGKRKTKKGKSVKKNPNNTELEPEELTRAPHSFVIHKGSVGRTVVDFTKDFRKVMEPYTASALKVRKKNVLKDFSAVAGILHVSHLVMFTSTEKASYVRFGRFPRGPTLTFRMLKYTLSREVLAQVRKQHAFDKAFRNFPLVVLNNFSGEGLHMKLMTTMFQNMFPTINITKVNLDAVRRCVLFNYNQEDKTIEFRHYGIRVTPVGLSRGVKKIIQSKVPSLSRYQDISEFILRGDVSESEAEDDAESHVTLPQSISSRGNTQDGQSAIRLHELGPRMTLRLVKIEGGLCEGEVIHHDLVKKTPEEIALINKRRVEKKKLKEQRKRTQEKNKQEKDRKKEMLKQKSMEGIERKKKEYLSEKAKNEANMDSNNLEEDQSDSEWYRQEVGEEPDKDLFTHTQSVGIKRKHMSGGANKRFKTSHRSRDSDVRDKESKNKNEPNRFHKTGRKSQFGSSNFVKKSQKNQQKSKRKVMGSKVYKGKRHK